MAHSEWTLLVLDNHGWRERSGGFLLELASGSLVVGERLQNPANAWNGRCSVVDTLSIAQRATLV